MPRRVCKMEDEVGVMPDRWQHWSMVASKTKAICVNWLLSIIALGEYKIVYWTSMSKTIQRGFISYMLGVKRLSGSFCRSASLVWSAFCSTCIPITSRTREQYIVFFISQRKRGKDSTRSSCLSLSLSLPVCLSILCIIRRGDTIV